MTHSSSNPNPSRIDLEVIRALTPIFIAAIGGIIALTVLITNPDNTTGLNLAGIAIAASGLTLPLEDLITKIWKTGKSLFLGSFSKTDKSNKKRNIGSLIVVAYELFSSFIPSEGIFQVYTNIFVLLYYCSIFILVHHNLAQDLAIAKSEMGTSQLN